MSLSDPSSPDTSKPWWASKTIIGSGVALLATVATLLGHPIPTDLSTQIVDVLVGAGGIIGSLIAIIGRFTAKTTLK